MNIDNPLVKYRQNQTLSNILTIAWWWLSYRERADGDGRERFTDRVWYTHHAQ